MDIFYYWKDFEADLSERRIGWLKSDRAKLSQLQDRGIDHIWAFKTPLGKKGRIQVVARLAWSNVRPKDAPASAGSMIFYDPASSLTVRFLASDSETAIDEVSRVIRKRFPRIFDANFQGDNGLQRLEIDCVRELENCTKSYHTAPLLSAIAAVPSR